VGGDTMTTNEYDDAVLYYPFLEDHVIPESIMMNWLKGFRQYRIGLYTIRILQHGEETW